MSNSHEEQLIEDLSERLIRDLLVFSGSTAKFVPGLFSGENEKPEPAQQQAAPAQPAVVPSHAHKPAAPSPAQTQDNPAQDGTVYSIRENGVETTVRRDPASDKIELSGFAIHDPDIRTGIHSDPASFHYALKNVCAAVNLHQKKQEQAVPLSPADSAIATSLKWTARQNLAKNEIITAKDTSHARFSVRKISDSLTLYTADLKVGRRLQIRDSNPMRLVAHVRSHLQAILPNMTQSQGVPRRQGLRITP